MSAMTLEQIQAAEESRYGGPAQPLKPPTQEQYDAKLEAMRPGLRRGMQDLAWYKKEYAAGYAAAGRSGDSTKWNNGSYTWAWEDGYLDRAAGRWRWHLAHCPDHDVCGYG